MNARTLFPVIATALVGAACADADPLSPVADLTEPIESSLVNSVQEVVGVTGPGAKYAVYVPQNWNGSLVLYVHGFRDVAAPVDLDNHDQDNILGLRDALTAQGFGVAYSIFSENGWAVRDGAIRTRELQGLFASRFGQPDRTYLVGHSLGALIATTSSDDRSLSG